MASASSLQLPVTIPLSSASNAEQIFPSKNISLIGFSGNKKQLLFLALKVNSGLVKAGDVGTWQGERKVKCILK
ncbi:hypothetical protein E3N88_20764 [Mikania micrantha]|uniref:Uncharacterized protein n=1 Tax=Mikania micrantha TaxID=192012 RepID=A0A5N6NHZ0_9ASTR|nr:hypothetical protein E3N88_20764 [Mikania micrantha]